MKREATYLTIVSVVAALLLALVVTAPARAVAPIVGNQTKTIAENSPNGTSPNPSQISGIDPEGQALTSEPTKTPRATRCGLSGTRRMRCTT